MSDLFSLSTRADRRMTKLKSILICLFFISTSSSVVLADSIQGCGGFVEASSYLIKSRKPSDSKLDYSHITVELRTVDGLVKDSTQCAPNGYYFIPVYDKGSFVIKIKGPEGWSWDPDKVPVVIDHNGCNANADINFRFTGFTLSGRVVGAVGGESCSSKDGGPSNVKVELLSVTDDLVSSTFTSAAGSYLFTNVLPGQYKLRASHPSLKIEVKGSSEVELGFGNGVVDDIFFVPGYDIQGSVVAQGNPILGVHIYLYSDDVLEVNCPQGFGNSPREKAALCHAISDEDGKFTFNSIPCGSYELLPYYKGENTVFDVSPPSMSVALEHRHVTVAQKFQVTGFSVGGRVIDGYGVGVDGVKIIVDGQERSSTDSQGRYKLDQVTSKHYTIVAKKDHYKFDNLENFLVLPNMASVADIKAVYYDVCGVVHTVSSGSRAKVALTHGPENVKPQVKQTDESGRFCFEVPSGEYRLSALAATQESFPELVFLPAYVDVKVNSPLFNVEFSQAQVDIRGYVLCKEKCGPSVFVSLISSSSTKKVEKKTVSLLEESTDFVFPKVFPGKYRLEVKHKSSSGANEDNWCWERNSIDVDVGTEDINEIVFVQKGYWIDIISTHDVDAYINQPDASVLSLQIKKGNQRICLESPGPHELHFVNSCIFFGSSSMKFDTSNLLPIYLKGEKYLLRGQIHVDSSLPHIEDDLANNINVDVLNSAGEVIGSGTSLLPNGDDQKGTVVYEYSVWANLGDVLTFVPRDSRNTEGKKILFYPREHHVSVTSDGCQATIPAFSGRLGLYMEGSVSPPLTGVEIRIISAGESKYVPIKKGELVLRTTTDSDGTFVAGPLYDDTDYRVEASKAGYHLKRVGPNSFSCQKLSQISVHIHSGDATEPFPSVLLSLSGEDNYRNNSASGVGGFFLFDNLFPGTFYLRPLLKEYSFSPSAQAIELGSGESKEVAFRATRVAYSAMGSVSLLSGQPVEGLSVEARSESGYFEETTTDSAGHYRLRGLLPDTSYLVKVVAKEELGSTKIERASPEHVEVKVGTEDIKGVDFVVFEQPEMTILSGHVEGTDLEELQSHLLVEVKSANDPSKIKSVLQLPLSNFFQIKNLPKSKYLIQLRYNARSSILKFESEIVEVDLEKQAQAHVGPLKYSVKEDFQKQELTTAPVFPLVAGVFVIFLFISMPRLNDLYQTSIAATGSATSVKKETRKPVVRKKTY